MSKLTGISGPASEALVHLLDGGEYTSTQFGLLRNKKTSEYLNNFGDGTTYIAEARKYSADDVNYLRIDSDLHEWVWVNAIYSLDKLPENDPNSTEVAQ
jgi:hypothetical protein